ncbi:Glutaminyl-tRNA synthetase [Tilletia horrida]|uniref:glutamine--tRNA ligase n=1 Tax=Tilletia horrida TaxID=155126 RepID=A0AAN6G7I7_9BASI|nr:Glutaminyl-tRNA synthetase [Tilletia horrida]
MAPKVNIADPAVAALLELFASSLALTGSKALDIVSQPKQATALSDTVRALNLNERSPALDAKTGSLVVSAVTYPGGSGSALTEEKRRYVVQRVLDGALKSTDQVTTALKYLEKEQGSEPADKADFDAACGVGVVITPEQCREAVTSYLTAHKAELDAVGGWPKQSSIMSALRAEPSLRWANALDVKNAVEAELTATYGDRKAANAAAAAAAKKEKEKEKQSKEEAKKDPKKNAADTQNVINLRPDAMFEEGFLSKLHKPGENPQIKPELKEQHLSATKGMVFTRFPPEPNGFLHVGHAKAIAVDFGFARFNNGLCYLRYDDTNPEAEEEQYFDSILEMVRWLGFEPWKITYSSDYFQQLYDLAVDLIKRGKAYVDHSTAEEMREQRGGEGGKGPRKASKWRDRPVEESLQDFEDMKNGKFAPQTATLRMKMDILNNPNPQMWDLVAYRVLSKPHHRTGSKWCIYPTYDFTHCLVDSMENISHSLCTTEFITARESYEWLCDALEVYKPRQYEFGRLSLEGTITSKRKILKLVREGYVKDWDDPRLFTLIALRRRGVPPGALLSFVNELGVTTAPTVTMSNRLDQTIRNYLEASTPRLMMVLNPLKVTITNLPADFYLEVEKPLHPKVPEMGVNKLPFTRTVYIDASDFRTEDSADYFRLAPGKTVGLLQVPHTITCTSFKLDEKTGRPIEVFATYDDGSAPAPTAGVGATGSKKKKPTYIQWVAEHAPSHSPVRLDEVRIFHPLFTSPNPAGETNFLDHVDTGSLEVVRGALIERGFWEIARASFKAARKEAEERTVRAKEAAKKAQRDTDVPILRAASSTDAGKKETETDEVVGKLNSAQLVGKECVRFQGMRIAYFALDRESKLGEALEEGARGEEGAQSAKIILNRIVTLKEDAGKTKV